MKIVRILIVVAFVLTMVSCGKGSPEPEVKVLHSNKELDIIYYGNMKNDKQGDTEKWLKEYMIGRRFEDLPVVEKEDIIEIINVNFDVETYEISDLILDKKANIVSNFEAEGTLVASIDDKATYTYEKLNDTSSYENYMIDEKSIHCLLIKCEIEKTDFVFAVMFLN